MTKFSIKTKDPELAKKLLEAEKMYNILFDLKHNFWRKWKYAEKDINGNNVLDELEKKLEDFNF